MQLKFDTTLDYFIVFIILVKIVFLFTSVGHLVASHSSNSRAKDLDATLVHWKERTEFIFIACMAVLLIYHFRPGHRHPISPETALLFFLFGVILLFTAKWSLFFQEAPWYKYLVRSVE
jgi:hypothetical protein